MLLVIYFRKLNILNSYYLFVNNGVFENYLWLLGFNCRKDNSYIKVTVK